MNLVDPRGLSGFVVPRLPPPRIRPALPKPPVYRPFPGFDPAKPPFPGFRWRGKPGSKPGDKDGNWYNPNTKESCRPDLDHPKPIGPHWDYMGPNGDWYRLFPDGSMVPKMQIPFNYIYSGVPLDA